MSNVAVIQHYLINNETLFNMTYFEFNYNKTKRTVIYNNENVFIYDEKE
jgi:hypothetical protein